MRIACSLVIALALAGSAACSRQKDASSCDAVGTRFLALARAEVAADAELDKDVRRAVNGTLAPMRDSMVRACREDRWASEARACFVGAADVAAFRACEGQLTAEQRELLRSHASRGLQPR